MNYLSRCVLSITASVLWCQVVQAQSSRLDYSYAKPVMNVGMPSAILVTNQDIWVGGENGLLELRSTQKVDIGKSQGAKSTNWVTDLDWLGDDKILVSVFGHGLFVLASETRTLTEIDTSKVTSKQFWKVDKSERHFAVSTLNDISIFNNSDNRFVISLKEEGVSLGNQVVDVVIEDSDSILWWIDSDTGLHYYSFESGKWGKIFLKEAEGHRFYSMTKKASTMHIGTDIGLIIFDLTKNTSKLISKRHEPKQTTQPVRASFEDSAGRIWVAAETLYQVDKDGEVLVESEFIQPGRGDDELLIITDLGEDVNGNIFAIDTLHGLIAFSELTMATSVLDNISGEGNVENVLFSNQGEDLLVEFSESVTTVEDIASERKVSKARLKIIHSNDKDYLFDTGMQIFIEDKLSEQLELGEVEGQEKGVLFRKIKHAFELDNNIFYLLHENNETRLYRFHQGLQAVLPYEVSQVHLSQEDTLIIAVDGVGIFEVNSSAEIFRYRLGIDHTYQIFSAIYSDNENVLVGTSGNGYFVIDLQTKVLKKEDNKLKFVRDLSSLKDYWVIASNNGLYAVGKKNDERILIGSSFGIVDTDFEFEGVAESEKLLFVQGDRQSYLLRKENLEKLLNELSQRVHKIALSSLEIRQKTRGGWIQTPVSTQLDLHAKELEFQLPPINYMERKLINYQFRVKEGDNKWRNLGIETTSFQLKDLHVGTHSLQIRTHDPRSFVEQPITTLDIHILPPWWRSWQALLLYALTILIICYAVYRSYLRRVGEQSVMLTKMVDEKNTALEDSSEFLDRILRKKQHYMANLSHEIRTPLTLIIGPLRQVMESPQSPETPARLDTATRNAKRIRILVDQMLEMEKLDHVKTRPRQHYDLDREVPKILYDLKPFAEAKTQTLSWQCSSGKKLALYEDSLEKILSNLVSNAVKYTQEGGEIRIKVSQKAMQLMIEVSDNGKGISTAYKEKVFERYTQLDKSKDGAGVGLALVKELVMANEGHISLSSEEGEGTTFTIWFPIVNVEYESSIKDEASEIAEKSPAIYDPSEDVPISDNIVLVVDDNDELRHYLHNLIRSHYHCLVAKSARQALEVAQRMKPDLMLTDYKMPGMDGLELTKAIRAQQCTTRLPVIVMSAFGDPQSIQLALKAGADSYLTKPVDKEILLLRISNVLARQQTVIVETTASEHTAPATDIPKFVSEQEQNFYFRFVKTIEAKYAEEDLSKSDVARALAVSERQLSRKLRSMFNKTFSEVLREFRLEQAKELLQEGRQITQIAFDVGFSSPSQLSRAFREAFGTTPSQYQQTHYRVRRHKA